MMHTLEIPSVPNNRMLYTGDSMMHTLEIPSVPNNHMFIVSDKQHLLAVGDSMGTLHVLEIPWSLRLPTPNEVCTSLFHQRLSYSSSLLKFVRLRNGPLV